MKLWVCIAVFNRIHFTMNCLASLAKQDYLNFQTVVYDSGSTDGTPQAISQKYPDVIILQGTEDLWWTGATNCCIKYAMEHSTDPSDCIITLNDDLEVPEHYISSLANAAVKHPGSLITSAAFDIKTRRMVSPGSRHSWLTTKSHAIDPRADHLPTDESLASVTHATGRGTLIPFAVFRTIGLFDEQHLPHYGSDLDFSFRATRAGYHIFVSFLARVYSHVEETGLTNIRKHFSLTGFYKYLTSIKSPCNINVRWWVAVKNCPRLLLPSFLTIDFLFVVGSYFKYHSNR